MALGRPLGSPIRKNMTEILNYAGKLHGYKIFTIYRKIFPGKTSMRSIYYHLKKGVSIKEFQVAMIRKETGKYSWGGEVERVYYELGPNAKPEDNPAVKEAISALKLSSENR